MSTSTDSVTASTSTDLYGNTYTTALSNDELDNEDFLTLMLTELSLLQKSLIFEHQLQKHLNIDVGNT